MKLTIYTGACATLIGLCVAVASATLNPEYRAALSDVAAVARALDDVNAAARQAIAQCQRAHRGLETMRTGDTAQELAALDDTAKALSARIKVALKALSKVDDGDPDPGMTARANGDLDGGP